MDYQDTNHWDPGRWEQEYEELMGIARKHLRQEWNRGEVVVLRTAKGRVHVIQIPDYQDHEERELLENQCIQTLAQQNDTEVLSCLATVNGQTPEIPSWNFRSRLMELNKNNLQAECYLWGGGENIYIKPFSRLLPPNYTIKKGT